MNIYKIRQRYKMRTVVADHESYLAGFQESNLRTALEVLSRMASRVDSYYKHPEINITYKGNIEHAILCMLQSRNWTELDFSYPEGITVDEIIAHLKSLLVETTSPELWI